MIGVAIVVLTLSLFSVFCVRHFFVQLVALKLFIDGLVFLLLFIRKAGQSDFTFQSTAFFLSSISCLIFFILMAAGTQRFSHSENLDLEADSD